MKWLYGLLAVLMLADGVITNILVNKGTCSELNPFLRGLAGHNSLLLAKIVGAGIAVALLVHIGRKRPRMAKVATIIFIIFYAIIILWNVAWL